MPPKPSDVNHYIDPDSTPKNPDDSDVSGVSENGFPQVEPRLERRRVEETRRRLGDLSQYPGWGPRRGQA